ncbi:MULTISPECIES: transcription elongation factor [Galbibacter]|uniref:Transcription elongation factor n=1 Tax=Galbibacter pacificus TaxID=2996052 RepID=A0ABT6FQN5_9FLAO|nr:transcription elongation factor [Galbibacter pacificus]MDG3581948.1 transcription elongation factor [Galbibacter pacificus]MDG3585578.1 transcription elongation factor [Galbibacter pacificus]
MNKEQLYHKCIDILNERIERYRAEINIIKESAENEDKTKGDEGEGSSGNGYGSNFTKILEYLEEANSLKAKLKQVDIFQTNDTVKQGSLVACSNGNFFLSIPLGKIILDGQTFFAISKEAPVGQLLIGKKIGDSISFNNNTYVVEKIY